MSNPDALKHSEAEVDHLPACDFCGETARYDGRTTHGSWAYMCENDFEVYSIGLGLGKGQRLITAENRAGRQRNHRLIQMNVTVKIKNSNSDEGETDGL
jgi:hypothetical protein